MVATMNCDQVEVREVTLMDGSAGDTLFHPCSLELFHSCPNNLGRGRSVVDVDLRREESGSGRGRGGGGGGKGRERERTHKPLRWFP